MERIISPTLALIVTLFAENVGGDTTLCVATGAAGA
jgi:hypothetical protein